mmetsp:Transcript_15763/g.25540  ORF Transcript_15763/g.25540 Transcript_15763/m.25540 type:complete len:549 (-) Transcript_15763:327-1973(-)
MRSFHRGKVRSIHRYTYGTCTYFFEFTKFFGFQSLLYTFTRCCSSQTFGFFSKKHWITLKQLLYYHHIITMDGITGLSMSNVADAVGLGGSNANTSEQFPYKLHRILTQAQQEGFDDIITWSPHGKSFRIFSKERFVEEVMPKFFDATKYKSFQRSLNLWQFQCVQYVDDDAEPVEGYYGFMEQGAIYHPLFVRGMPHLCDQMTRIKVKGRYRRGMVKAEGSSVPPSPSASSKPNSKRSATAPKGKPAPKAKPQTLPSASREASDPPIKTVNERKTPALSSDVRGNCAAAKSVLGAGPVSPLFKTAAYSFSEPSSSAAPAASPPASLLSEVAAALSKQMMSMKQHHPQVQQNHLPSFAAQQPLLQQLLPLLKTGNLGQQQQQRLLAALEEHVVMNKIQEVLSGNNGNSSSSSNNNNNNSLPCNDHNAVLAAMLLAFAPAETRQPEVVAPTSASASTSTLHLLHSLLPSSSLQSPPAPAVAPQPAIMGSYNNGFGNNSRDTNSGKLDLTQLSLTDLNAIINATKTAAAPSTSLQEWNQQSVLLSLLGRL